MTYTAMGATYPLLRMLVIVGVPLVGFYLMMKAPERRTNPLGGDLVLFFGLTLFGALGTLVGSLTFPLITDYIRNRGLGVAQFGWIWSLIMLPFSLARLAAWVSP